MASMAHAEGVIQLPQTGQTRCYDSAGTEITCAGTGQDGEIQAGVVWPNPRFTDKGDQTVLDNLTGLVWAKDGNVMKTRDPGFDTDSTDGDGKVYWQHALDYIKKLNYENYLGHNDWRLPNIIELESLVHAGQSNTAYWLSLQGFSNVQADYYWSSSTYAHYSDLVWIVYVYDGIVDYYGKYSNYYVWPVRSGQSGSLGSSIISLPRTGQTTCYNDSGATIACTGTGQDGELQMGAVWPNPRFTDKGDQTVMDNLTGLIWTKDGKTPGQATCGPSEYKTWQEALDYVKCLNTNNYLGHNDWRLPNRKELDSLVHAGQSNITTWLSLQGFSNVQAYYYWSSSTYANITDFAWVVYMSFYYGVSNGSKSSSYYAWPVRAGQVRLLTLNQGWNLISFPKLPSDTNVATVLNDISSNVRIVWGFDNNTKAWLKWKPSTLNPLPFALCSIESWEGYWIYMDQPGTINMTNWTAQSTTVSLSEGWNLIGYNGTDDIGVTTALNSISGKWTIIWNWDSGTWYAKHATVTTLPVSELTNLYQGKAYWIKMKEAANWSQ